MRKWFKVNEHISKVRKLCEQSIFDMMTDSVSFCDCEVLINFHAITPKAVVTASYPAMAVTGCTGILARVTANGVFLCRQ